MNHDGLTDASLGEYAGMEGFANIDFVAIDDKITAQEESDEVTQEQQNAWHASKLDPTQKLLHDHICQTWFHGILADYALRRKPRKLQIKEFGTAGSGKTRLNRTMVVSLRSTQSSIF